MKKTRPNLVVYRLAQVVSWFVATFLFKRKILRNEIKGKQGASVVIANHQAQYDFVNLIGLTHRFMRFVISSSFYNALSIKWVLDKMGVIPKQQFQTTVKDMKKMKSVVEAGAPLVIYPAGLMCEDGLSTPIPAATYKFLKWLGVDVYMAKTKGTYFAMPKWSKGIRPGRTYLDVYKLFDREELAEMDVPEIRARAEEALLFDAYREQEELLVKYKNSDNIEGLENVLYMCPHCQAEFTMEVRNGSTIRCSRCGYEQTSDRYAFLHHNGGVGAGLRYVSDWSKLIHDTLKARMERGEAYELSLETKIHMTNGKRFAEVGQGTLSLSREQFTIRGRICGEETELEIPIANLPTLPFSPGKYLEIQKGETIYRCVLDDGKQVMKLINMVKIFYELNWAAAQTGGQK